MLLERGGARTRQTNTTTITNGKAFSPEAADANDKAKITRAKGETETYNANLHGPLRNIKSSKLLETLNPIFLAISVTLGALYTSDISIFPTNVLNIVV